jgi:hypothetical protein
MNDYQQILYASHALTPKQLYDVNWESRSRLARKLEKPYAGKTVVVTHHAPTLQRWPATKDTTLQATYCNRLDDFFPVFQSMHGFMATRMRLVIMRETKLELCVIRVVTPDTKS